MRHRPEKIQADPGLPQSSPCHRVRIHFCRVWFSFFRGVRGGQAAQASAAGQRAGEQREEHCGFLSLFLGLSLGRLDSRHGDRGGARARPPLRQHALHLDLDDRHHPRRTEPRLFHRREARGPESVDQAVFLPHAGRRGPGRAGARPAGYPAAHDGGEPEPPIGAGVRRSLALRRSGLRARHAHPLRGEARRKGRGEPGGGDGKPLHLVHGREHPRHVRDGLRLHSLFRTERHLPDDGGGAHAHGDAGALPQRRPRQTVLETKGAGEPASRGVPTGLDGDGRRVAGRHPRRGRGYGVGAREHVPHDPHIREGRGGRRAGARDVSGSPTRRGDGPGRRQKVFLRIYPLPGIGAAVRAPHEARDLHRRRRFHDAQGAASHEAGDGHRRGRTRRGSRRCGAQVFQAGEVPEAQEPGGRRQAHSALIG